MKKLTTTIIFCLSICYSQTGFFTNEDEKSWGIFVFNRMDMDNYYLHSSENPVNALGVTLSYFKDDLEFETIMFPYKNYAGISYHIKSNFISSSVGVGSGKFGLINRSISKISFYIQRRWMPFVTFTKEEEKNLDSSGRHLDYTIYEFGINRRFKQIPFGEVFTRLSYEFEKENNPGITTPKGTFVFTIGKVFHSNSKP